MIRASAASPLRVVPPRELPLGERAMSGAPRSLNTARPAFVMGIVNVNDTSFWKGSRLPDPERAAEAALRMEAEGADVIDIGAESSRPGADYLDAAQEIDSIVPVIQKIRRASAIPISVDTRKKSVMEAAWDAGADIVNDISALEDDGELGLFAARHGLPVILMHKRGVPADMQLRAAYGAPLAEIGGYLAGRAAHAVSLGIGPDRIILDPGIGFGKDILANRMLMESSSALASYPGFPQPFPVLIGLSRKSCIGTMTGRAESERLPGSLAAGLLSVLYGASYLRVHDVKETVDMLAVLQALTEYSIPRESLSSKAGETL